MATIRYLIRSMSSGNQPLNTWSFLIFLFFGLSCIPGSWEIPSGLIGYWEANEVTVTVRFKEKKREHSRYMKGPSSFTLTINPDKTASGTIGFSAFEQAIIRKNPGNPNQTGIAYIIECGEIGKIFENDPVDRKEVEIWLKPLRENGMGAELRKGNFPMGDMLFQKIEK